MKAVIYARVSNDDSTNATSGIEGQLEDGRKYAVAQGYSVVGEYFEEPTKQTSGADWLPEIEKVVNLAETAAFEVLIVHKVDRLARNRFKQMSIENSLEYAGVRVEYVNGQYGDNPEGRLLKGLVSEFAEYEREIIRERTRRGIMRSVAAGNVTVGGSCAPYGYDLVKVENGNSQRPQRRLAVNEEEATAVKLIFNLYVNKGYTLNMIGGRLDKLGIPKPAKGNNHKARDSRPNWPIGTLSNILNNETYVGRWHYRKTKRTKVGPNQYKSLPRPKEEWLMVEVPAIIDEDLFEKVKERRGKNKRQIGKNRKRIYLLGGMVRCGDCGRSATAFTLTKGGKEYSYYRCSTRTMAKRTRPKCNLKSLNRTDVDTAVWNWVRSIILSPELLHQSLEAYQKRQEDDNSPLLSMLEANKNKLADLAEEKDRLIKAYAAGVLTLDEIATGKADLDKQIADLAQAIEKLTQELDSKSMTPVEMESIEALATQYQEEVEEVEDDPQAKRYILQRLNVEATLIENDKGRFVDALCILGQKKLSTDQHKRRYMT